MTNKKHVPFPTIHTAIKIFAVRLNFLGIIPPKAVIKLLHSLRCIPPSGGGGGGGSAGITLNWRLDKSPGSKMAARKGGIKVHRSRRRLAIGQGAIIRTRWGSLMLHWPSFPVRPLRTGFCAAATAFPMVKPDRCPVVYVMLLWSFCFAAFWIVSPRRTLFVLDGIQR